MLKLQHLPNKEEIYEYLKKDNIYKNILGLDNLDKYVYNNTTEMCCLMLDNAQIVGIILLKPVLKGYMCLHGGIYKEFRGSKSLQYVKQLKKQLKKIVYPNLLITTVPETNRLANKLVEAAGFKFKKTFINNGINFNLYKE